MSLRVGFRISNPQARPTGSSLPAAYDPSIDRSIGWDEELLAASPVQCLPALHHPIHHDENGLNLSHHKATLTKCFPL